MVPPIATKQGPRGYGRPRPVAVGGAPRAKRAAAASSGEEIIQSIHQHLLKLPEVKHRRTGMVLHVESDQ